MKTQPSRRWGKRAEDLMIAEHSIPLKSVCENAFDVLSHRDSTIDMLSRCEFPVAHLGPGRSNVLAKEMQLLTLEIFFSDKDSPWKYLALYMCLLFLLWFS
jgi:hypothetical protein